MSNLINFYNTFKNPKIHNPYEKIHDIKLPFRALINCASGGGKTNLVMNILYMMDSTFHDIVIVSKAEEPLYDHLVDTLKNVKIYYNGVIPDIEKLDKGQNGLIIFDDMVLTPNNKIGELFIRGRKLYYSCIFITQSFFGTPKIVRQNVNYVWLGRGINKRDLRLLLSEFSIGISIDELESIYNHVTKENMNFMLIDLNKRILKKNININILEY
jgi:hypothetical protein